MFLLCWIEINVRADDSSPSSDWTENFPGKGMGLGRCLVQWYMNSGVHSLGIHDAPCNALLLLAAGYLTCNMGKRSLAVVVSRRHG